MPYEQEKSSILATANFNNNIEKYLQNNFYAKIKHHDYQSTVLKALENNPHCIFKASSLEDIDIEEIICIDGSILEKKYDNNVSFLAFQTGSAYIDLNQLINLSKNNFNNYNPAEVASIYSNPKNKIISHFFPGQNVLYENNNKTLDFRNTLKKSFNELKNQPYFMNIWTNFYLLSSHLNNDILNHYDPNKTISKFEQFDSTKLFLNFLKNIDNSYNCNSYNNITQFMLLLENLTALYHIFDKSGTTKIVVLDGRLDNYLIGKVLHEIYTKNKIVSDTNILISVQKSGAINQITPMIENIFKNKYQTQNIGLQKFIQAYQNQEAIFIKLTQEIKKDLKLPQQQYQTSYGTEFICLLNEHQHFIFSIENSLIENSNNIHLTQLLSKITYLFKKTATSLYIKNKGVLIPNVVAHNNVALNKKNTLINIESDNLSHNNQLSKPKPKF